MAQKSFCMTEKEPETGLLSLKQIQGATGYELIPPYDDLDILAGQGTVALETLKYLETIDCKIDTFPRNSYKWRWPYERFALALRGIDPSKPRLR